ncbi:MAG: sulfotransferase family 2 domain-containing protein [Alphaproteobacteria bacterium]|nr:sulfotransferase family 2 domain-containing protein [Alphaproteobacteria bacterium]
MIDSFIDVSLILIAIVSVALALFCFKKGKLFFTVFIVFLICATFKTIYYKSDRDFTLMNNSLSVEDKNLSDKRIKFKDSGNKIIFMHLAKTAGTSVIENFSKFYPSFSPSSFTCKDNPKVQRNVFIRSHNIKAFILPKFNLQNKSKITFFRDPRDRILSLYYYMISNSKKYPTSFTLLEYLNLKEKYLGDNERDLFIDNIYTRYFISRDIKTGEEITQNDIDEAISYLKTLDFIGITENFDEDLDRMSDFYYLPRPEKKVVLNSFNKNKVEYKKKMKKELVKEPITPEIEKELDRLTKYDYIIYNAAKKIRDEQVKKWKAGKMKRAMGE